MSSVVAILRADVADVDAILRIQKAAFAEEARLYDDWTIAPLVERPEAVRADLEAKVVLKATLDGVLVGSVRVAFAADTSELGRLSVAPASQRRGIGLALLLAAENAFPHARQMLLFTGERSEGNLRLYRKAGYRPTGEKLHTGKVALIYLRKPLAPAAGEVRAGAATRVVNS